MGYFYQAFLNIQHFCIKHDLSLLLSFQEQEIDYADYIKDKLNIPYIMCNISEEEKIYAFIEDLVSL